MNPASAPSVPLAQQLLSWFAAADIISHPLVVALSGGVDSAVVAKAAALGHADVLAATASSASVADVERRDALALAQAVGLEHVWVETNELQDEAYQRNDARRCYFCKSRLYGTLGQRFPGRLILSGTNLDDLGDYRPGLQAAKEAGVRSPLAELHIGKGQVRELAQLWGLSVADKPASPCLASRIAHGVPVTTERLQRIERAEQLLRELGWREFRVRHHADELARIELPAELLSELIGSGVVPRITAELKRLGFRYVTLDLEGFRSGSLQPVFNILH